MVLEMVWEWYGGAVEGSTEGGTEGGTGGGTGVGTGGIDISRMV